MTISPRAQQFQNILEDRGLDLSVSELPASTRTADEAAQALGCDKAQIVKSLVFRIIDSNEPILVLASGVNRVNEKAIARLVGARIGKADADFVKEVTGFTIGGIPPLGHKTSMRLFVDEDLLAFDEVWAAAGTPHAVFKIPGLLSEILPEHEIVSIK